MRWYTGGLILEVLEVLELLEVLSNQWHTSLLPPNSSLGELLKIEMNYIFKISSRETRPFIQSIHQYMFQFNWQLPVVQWSAKLLYLQVRREDGGGVPGLGLFPGEDPHGGIHQGDQARRRQVQIEPCRVISKSLILPIETNNLNPHFLFKLDFPCFQAWYSQTGLADVITSAISAIMIQLIKPMKICSLGDYPLFL